jgi:hypothetical protein
MKGSYFGFVGGRILVSGKGQEILSCTSRYRI